MFATVGKTADIFLDNGTCITASATELNDADTYDHPEIRCSVDIEFTSEADEHLFLSDAYTIAFMRPHDPDIAAECCVCPNLSCADCSYAQRIAYDFWDNDLPRERTESPLAEYIAGNAVDVGFALRRVVALLARQLENDARCLLREAEIDFYNL